MLVAAGIAVLCVGDLLARYIREKYHAFEFGPDTGKGAGGPDTLVITLEYWSGPRSSSGAQSGSTDALQISNFNSDAAKTIIHQIQSDVIVKYSQVSH